MTLAAANFQLRRGIVNSLITYFGGDSLDVLTPDGLPEESVEFLRKMANYYSEKDKRLAEFKGTNLEDDLEDYYETGVLTYSLLNKFGGINNLYDMKESDNSAASSLKYILGQFTLKEVEENGIKGYRIYDKYDFKNNQEYFASVMPEIYQDARGKGYDTSAVDGHLYMMFKAMKKNVGRAVRNNPISGLPSSLATAIGHPVFRTLGGWFIGEDRPEEDKIKIDFFIPKKKGDAYLEDDTVMPVEYAENRVTDMPNAPMLRPENFAAYIPVGPMDNTRAKAFNAMMSSVVPEQHTLSLAETGIPDPNETTPLTPFQKAFAEARARGDETFEFTTRDGKTQSYNTELA